MTRRTLTFTILSASIEYSTLHLEAFSSCPPQREHEETLIIDFLPLINRISFERDFSPINRKYSSRLGLDKAEEFLGEKDIPGKGGRQWLMVGKSIMCLCQVTSKKGFKRDCCEGQRIRQVATSARNYFVDRMKSHHKGIWTVQICLIFLLCITLPSKGVTCSLHKPSHPLPAPGLRFQSSQIRSARQNSIATVYFRPPPADVSHAIRPQG